MADNVAITAGSGTTIAADDIAGVLHQRVKVQHGADGSATDVSTASPMPVQIRTSGGAEVDFTATSPVYGPIQLVDVTLSLDTSAYTAGDLIADTQEVASAVRAADAKGVLQSVVVIDEDDQGAAIDLYFFSANVTMGTENSAPSISDANIRNLLGIVSVASGDYKDVGGAKVAVKSGIGMIVQPASGTDDIYVAVVSNGSTPTYTASGVRLRIGVLS